MLDINVAIDNSFSELHNAPRFVPGALAPMGSERNSDERFITDMNQRFQLYQVGIAEWLERGRNQMARLEYDLKENQVIFGMEERVRIQLLIDNMTDQVEQDIEYNLRGLKRMMRTGREIREFSPTAGKYIIDLVERIRIVAEVEMNGLIEAIDWWSAIRAAHAPDNVRSKAFDDPADLIAHLRSS